ncbi:hypothetical protein HHI36_011992 [Cryptolaemus montrouzieri]|uniref:Uncharacterized protein n=1 Tax=Cryptolaemus montrouzieri TaxID=559131 RepID=A0ABD2NDV1_9CUCU
MKNNHKHHIKFQSVLLKIKTTSHKTNLSDPEYLENNVIISGIAEDDLKNPDDEKKIVVKIAKFCDVDINEADMKKCYQIGNNGKKQIKLVFRDKEKKELFMSKRKESQITTKNLKLTGDSIIYLNHELTRQNQLLFKLTRDKKRELQYKFAWFAQEKYFYAKLKIVK